MKKLLALLSVMGLVILLCACGGQDSGDTSENGDIRTITDAVGRTVEIPTEVEGIVPLGNTPRMITYLGLADKVVGIGECEIAESPIQAYAYVNKDAWSALPVCGTDAMGEVAYYPEELILAAPDVILCTYTADVADNIQTQTGIPTVAVPHGELLSADYEQALRIIGEVCGVSDRAEKLIDYINSCVDDLRTRCASIPDENKPTVLASGATFKGSHSIDGVYIDYPVFELLSAKDAAAGAAAQGSSGVMVDREMILEWDPDMIFFDAGSMGLVRSDFAENSGYFEQLSAVKNGELYQWPNSTWHWTNVEIPIISAYYTGSLLYPEAFADVDFEEKASEIFEMFLNEPDYLSVLEEAGLGYGKVSLGE